MRLKWNRQKKMSSLCVSQVSSLSSCATHHHVRLCTASSEDKTAKTKQTAVPLQRAEEIPAKMCLPANKPLLASLFFSFFIFLTLLQISELCRQKEELPKFPSQKPSAVNIRHNKHLNVQGRLWQQGEWNLLVFASICIYETKKCTFCLI